MPIGVRSAQVGMQEVVQAAAHPMIAGDRLPVAQMAKADFHHFRLMGGSAEARGQRPLQRGQQASGVVRRLIDRAHVHAQAGDARRFAEDIEERLADRPIARIGAMVGPLHGGVDIHLDRNARCASGGGRCIPTDPVEAPKHSGGGLSE